MKLINTTRAVLALSVLTVSLVQPVRLSRFNREAEVEGHSGGDKEPPEATSQEGPRLGLMEGAWRQVFVQPMSEACSSNGSYIAELASCYTSDKQFMDFLRGEQALKCSQDFSENYGNPIDLAKADNYKSYLCEHWGALDAILECAYVATKENGSEDTTFIAMELTEVTTCLFSKIIRAGIYEQRRRLEDIERKVKNVCNRKANQMKQLADCFEKSNVFQDAIKSEIGFKCHKYYFHEPLKMGNTQQYKKNVCNDTERFFLMTKCSLMNDMEVDKELENKFYSEIDTCISRLVKP